MNKKIRSISLTNKIDNELIEDSRYRGLTISANVTRILYDYFQNNQITKQFKVLRSDTTKS